MLTIVLFLVYFSLFKAKNIVLPFKKLTIEYFNETKSISDFVDFNIYTNISMGTPQKEVAHFIMKSNKLFFYGPFEIHRHYKSSEFNDIENEIKNSFDNFYNIHNSSSVETINSLYNLYSDIFYFYDLDKNKKNGRLKFMISYDYLEDKKKLIGRIDLYCQEGPHDIHSKYIFKELKEASLIDESYITFIYGEYDLNNSFNYLNDNYNNILGTLILGDSPHKFAPDKYKEEDEIKINGRFALDIKKVKVKPLSFNYSEIYVILNIKFTSEFIKGSKQYRDKIDSVFFNELIKTNICRIDYIEENIIVNKDILYSCENNDIIKEKIQFFPTLYFEIKDSDLIFLFNYKELFKLHNNRLYFLIYFDNKNSTNWEIGELFLRKYITSFNYYSKTISFYKTQVDEINKKTDIYFPDEETDENKKNENPENKNRIWIILGIIAIICLIAAVIFNIILYIKLKKFRKKKARELNDDEYDYSSVNKIN